jgi:putative heme-binding domain-containing protein
MLARNPFYAGPKAMFDSAEASDQLPIYRISPVEPWRELRAQQWSNDSTKSKTPRSELSGGGVFTSASGLAIYRGDQYGASYRGQAFLGEVANNVIYRQTMKREGIVFRAERADKMVEFVASKDTWFRPVNLVNAPDGTLHVLDMYREYIEHPWSIPDDIHSLLDLENGRDRGRIYRLEPPNFHLSTSPRLGVASDEELVAALNHKNAWWRETAHRLLIERDSRTSKDMLKRLWMSASVQGRIHILWVLATLQELDDVTLLAAMKDAASEVREQAIEIVTRRLRSASPIISRPISGAMVEAVLQASDDPDPRVRFRAANAIGDLKSEAAADALAKIAMRDGSDLWMRAAILSSPSELTYPIVKKYLGRFEGVSQQFPDAAWAGEAFSVLGAQGNAEVLAAAIQTVDKLELLYRKSPSSSPSPRNSGSTKSKAIQNRDNAMPTLKGVEAVESMWAGLLMGLRRNGKSFQDFFEDWDLPTTAIVEKRIADAKEVLIDRDSTDSARLLAFQWMGFEPWGNAKVTLLNILDAAPKPPIQIAAVQAIGRYREPEVGAALLLRWSSYTPTVREAVFSALLARKERVSELLNAIADGRVSISTIDASRKSQILAFNDKKVQDRAKELFSQSIHNDRAAVVEKYRQALELQGDVDRGKMLYTKHCAACHRWKGQGVDLGPNLETVQSWDGPRLILNIFDPHREVAGQYLSYSVLLNDGRTFTGTIADETATSITLKQKEVAPQTILLSEIEQLANSGVSLMPNGLEEQISLQDMADLLEALKQR